MPLFFRFLVIFLIAGIPFHIFSPLNAKESLSFYCPHQCGQFGSKDIQNVEWKFVELLYQADKIQSFLSQNSKLYDPKISKDFFEFVFSYPKPKDFQSNWYQAMIRYISKNDWMRLNISDLDTYQRDCCDEYDSYNGSHCYIWGIRSIENEKNAHVGKVFIKHECNHIEESYDEDGDLESYGWDHQEGNTFSPCPETQYRLDHVVDFKQACFDLNQELIWLRDEVHRLHQFITKQEVKSISDIQYKEFIKDLEELKQHYSQIYSSCAENHQAPSAFYQMALEYFEIGDYARGLQSIKNVFKCVDLNTLEPHLASEISFSKGSIQNEIALYDKALVSLKKALERDPKNKNAYFNQALALFEQGRFEESLESYLHSGHSLQTINPITIQLFEFSTGLIKGITLSATESLVNFIPPMCSSLYGLSHGLWT